MKKATHLIQVFFALFLVQQVVGQIPFTCKGQFILTLSRNGDSRLALVEIDPVTNAVDFGIINNSMRVDINAIGYRKEENLIYGIDPNFFQLYRVDALGSVQTLAQLPLDSRLVYFAGDITPDGRYLVLIGGTSDNFAARDEEMVKVDLTQPGYPVQRFAISGPSTRIYDIAFNPLTGVLYGFDSNNERLVRIDHETGEVFADYPSTSNVDNAGSLFFDAFGNLFAYGGPFLSEQNRFYSVNTETGEFTVLASGPDAQGTDACSCPYTLEMKKTVNVDWAYPCEEVVFAFIIANGSGKVSLETHFYDPLPPGYTFVEVVKNPFSGTVLSQPGQSVIDIRNLIIPQGIDTLYVKVNVGDLPEGRYYNQARLLNLPQSLGGQVVSDEPRTLKKEDSTYLDIRRIPFEDKEEEWVICDDELVSVDYSEYGRSMVWSDGVESLVREFDGAADLTGYLIAGCDTASVSLVVREEYINLTLSQYDYLVELEDSVAVEAMVNSSGDSVFYTWYDHSGKRIECGECSHVVFYPKFSGTYTLVVTNEFGCTDVQEITVTVEKQRNIYAPNVFSPNGDNINDRFFLMSKKYGKVNNLYIYDRWGELIYQNGNFFVNDESAGWDGYFNNERVLPGVYVWMADVTFFDGANEFFTGDVTLMR